MKTIIIDTTERLKEQSYLFRLGDKVRLVNDMVLTKEEEAFRGFEGTVSRIFPFTDKIAIEGIVTEQMKKTGIKLKMVSIVTKAIYLEHIE